MKERQLKEIDLKPTKSKVEKTYKTALEMQNLFQAIKNTGLSVASLTSLVKLKSEVESITGEFYEAQKALMEKHEVPKENDQYKLDVFDKEKKDLIVKEREELLKTSVKFRNNFNFMSWKEIHASTADLPTDLIAMVAKWLVKDE